MAKQRRPEQKSTASLAELLTRLRGLSRLTQAQVAERMSTTQTAIARLESGRQSPKVQTLQSFAHANGFCLEIGFVGGVEPQKGCIWVIEDTRSPDEKTPRASDEKLITP